MEIREFSWREDLEPRLRVLQIIVTALILGVLFFLGVVLIMPFGQILKEPLLTYIALGFTAFALVGSWFVPQLVDAGGRRSILKGMASSSTGNAEDDMVIPLCNILQVRTIVGSAMLEGAAFFTTVAYMLERSPLCLGAVAVLILVLLSRIITRGRMVAWLARQLQLLEDER